MRSLIVFSVFLACPAASWAGQALMTSATVQRSYTIPNKSPYTAVSDARLEFRMKVGPCGQGANFDNVIRLRGVLGIGCPTTGSANLGIYNGNVIIPIPFAFASGVEYFFRLERINDQNSLSLHWWKYDGADAGTFSTAIDPNARGMRNMFTAPGAQYLVRNTSGFEISWVRWYSTILSAGAPMPKETPDNTNDMVGRWEFDGNANDSIGELNLSPAPAGGDYVDSAAYPPTVSVSYVAAQAGESVVLSAAGSFTFDEATITEYNWKQTQGPTEVFFSDTQSMETTVDGIVAGTYEFRLSVLDSRNRRTQVEKKITFRNLDADGFAILPSNTQNVPLTVAFRTDDIPGAVGVRVTIRKPDGRTLPPVICRESPCTVKVDSRQRSHFVMLDYLDDKGETLSKSSYWDKIARIASASLASEPTNTFTRPYIKLWGLQSGNVGGPDNVNRISKFLGSKTDYFSGGELPLRKMYPNVNQPVYSDQAALYPSEIYNLYDVARAHGYKYEDMLLHMRTDYQTTGGYIWSGMDKFDAFEPNNGVVLVNGSVQTDRTTAAYDGVQADVSITDKIMLGYAEPFDEVNFQLSTPATDANVSWEYWNGNQWASLTPYQDGTLSGSQRLSRSGKVLFTPPSDWAASVQSGTRSKWWVRIAVSGSGTPVASRIYGDNWLAPTRPLSNLVLPGSVLVGASSRFSSISMDVNVPRAGGTVRWQYWAGTTWKDLTVDDGTNQLTQNGTISFATPSDWTAASFGGEPSNWWLICRVTSPPNNVTRYPTVTGRINGEVAQSWQQSRGWDPSDPARVNVGSGALEYNPHPPAGASARFRYQGRALGIWANNNFFLNPGDVQNDERTTSRMVVDRVADRLAAGWNGLIVDNGNGVPTISTPYNWQDFTEMAGKNYLDENTATYTQIGSYMRSLSPDYANYVLCVNATYWKLVKNGSCFYEEHYRNVHNSVQPWYYRLTGQSPALAPEDHYESAGSPAQLLPENNPTGVIGWFSIWDTQDTEWTENNGTILVRWDHAIRTPMAAMSSYYIWANENTRFFYLTDGGFRYYGLDDFEYHDETPEWATGADLHANWTAETKTLTGDFSSFPTEGMVRMGFTGEFIKWKKVNNSQLTTNELIAETYPAGTLMYRIKTGRMSSDDLPPIERIRRWRQYLPAMAIDIGVPDQDGYNRGQAKMFWKSAAESGTLNGIQRRDFTKAIVLFASAFGVTGSHYNSLNEYSTCTNLADVCEDNAFLLGGTYYPLRPDGTTGPGIDRIRLRSAEGVVLMKEPVY